MHATTTTPTTPDDRAELPGPRLDRRRSRLAAAIVSMALLAGACGGSGGAADDDTAGATPDPTSVPTGDPDTIDVDPVDAETGPADGTEPETAWDRLAAEAATPDGAVPLETALAGFSLAFGALPGVELPDGPAGDVDGTAAMDWMAQHLDELTPEQRAAVDIALTPLDGNGNPVLPPAPAGRSALPQADAEVRGCYGEVPLFEDVPSSRRYRRVVDRAVFLVEERLGPLLATPYVGFGPGSHLADAAGYAPDCDSTATSCTIRITPFGASAPTDRLLQFLVHEVVHCFQAATIPIRDHQRRPAWLKEGFPTYAGLALGGDGPLTSWWRTYLTHPWRSLYSQSYEALGFFALIEASGQDPFLTFRSAYYDATLEGEFRGAAGSAYDVVMSTWASSFARESDRGLAWDATGPLITPHVYDRGDSVAIAEGEQWALGAGDVASQLAHLTLDAEVITTSVAPGTFGRLGFDSHDDVELRAGDDVWCNRDGGCECPEGSPGAGTATSPVPSIGVLVAITGWGAAGGLIEVRGMSLDDLCGEAPEVPPAVEACLVGTWVSDAFVDPGPIPDYDAVGGDGAVVVIAADGTVDYDLDPMASLVSFDTQIDIGFESASFGEAHGHITATGGVVTLVDLDDTLTYHTLSVGGLQNELPAGPAALIYLASTTTYTCAGDQLVTTQPDVIEGGTIQITFQRQH
jgi:hypothetical protein